MTVVALTLALAASASAQFRSDQTVEGVVGPNRNEQLVVTGNHAYCLYENRRSGLYELFFRSSRNGGRSLTNEKLLQDDTASWPALAGRGPLAVVSYFELAGGGHNPGADRLWVRVSRNGGKSFTRREIGTPTLTDSSDYPIPATDGTNIYLMWAEDGGDYYLQDSADQGRTWLPAARPGLDVEPGMLLVEGDRLSVFQIEDVRFGNHNLLFRRSLDRGVTWTDPVLLDEPIPTHRILGAKVRQSGDRLIASWRQERSTDGVSDLMVTTSGDAGSSWSTPVRVNHAPIDTGSVLTFGVDLRGDDVLAAYAQAFDGLNKGDAYARWSTDGGLSWSPEHQLNTTTSSAGKPMMRIRAGIGVDRGLVTWLDPVWSARSWDLLGASTTSAGQSWNVPFEVNPSGWSPIFEYQFDADDEGAFGVLFEDGRAGNGDVDLFLKIAHLPDVQRNGHFDAGQTASFTIRSASAAEEGGLAVVMLSSTGDGRVTGGFSIPGHRTVPLDFDDVTLLSLTTLLRFFSAPVIGGSATTPDLHIPPGLSLPPLWAAALILPPGGGFGGLSDTLKVR